MEDVNHEQFGRYLRQHQRQLGSISKIIHQQINTFRVCYRWGTSDSTLCPNCRIEEETISHIFRCPNLLMQQARNDGIQRILTILRKLKTDPDILELIQQILTCYATDYPSEQPKPSVKPKNMYLLQLYRSQEAIGWLSFHKGLISKHFGLLQEIYYKKIQAPKQYNVDRWSMTLLREMINYSRNIWKNRCDIVAIKDEFTLEQRVRKEAKIQYNNLKKKFWTLRVQDRDLVQRDEGFFDRAPFQNVVFWTNQVKIAQDNAKYQASKDTQDLRNFFKVTHTKNVNTSYHSGIPSYNIIPQQALHKCTVKKKKRKINSKDDTNESKLEKWLVRISNKKKTDTYEINEKFKCGRNLVGA